MATRTKKQVSNNKPRSVALRMTQVRLPSTAWYLCTSTGHIWPLEGLTLVPAEGGRCACKNMVRATITYCENTTDVPQVNTFDVSVDDCYETLKDAQDAYTLYLRRKKRDAYKYTHSERRMNQLQRAQFLKGYPDLVMAEYENSGGLLDDEGERRESLTHKDYVHAAHFYYNSLLDAIVAREFPDLEGEPEDD